MNYKIIGQNIKDVSFEIPDAKSAFFLDKNIKNYRFVCDIKSEKIKENIIQIDVKLKLSPIEKRMIKLFMFRLILHNNNS